MYIVFNFNCYIMIDTTVTSSFCMRCDTISFFRSRCITGYGNSWQGWKQISPRFKAGQEQEFNHIPLWWRWSVRLRIYHLGWISCGQSSEPLQRSYRPARLLMVSTGCNVNQHIRRRGLKLQPDKHNPFISPASFSASVILCEYIRKNNKPYPTVVVSDVNRTLCL